MLTVQDRIHRLLWDRRILAIPKEISPISAVIIKNPSLKDYNYSLFLKENIYEECIANGVPTETEILITAKESGYWTADEEDLIKRIDDYVEGLKDKLGREKLTVRIKKIKKQITEAQTERDNLAARRKDLLKNTAEYLSYENAVFNLLPKCVLDIEENPLWKTDEDFTRDRRENPVLVSYIANHVIQHDMMTTADMRSVARSPDWRALWTMSRENLAGLFEQSIGTLRVEQKVLLFWSRLYDSVYEDMERPDEEVIEDDEALDEWLTNRHEKREDKSSKPKPIKTGHDHAENMVVLDGYHSEECTCGTAKIKVLGHGERPKHATNCPWGVWIRYTEEEKFELAQRVYSKNNMNVRKVMESHHSTVAEHGTIKEQQLRSRKTRMMLGLGTKNG